MVKTTTAIIASGAMKQGTALNQKMLFGVGPARYSAHTTPNGSSVSGPAAASATGIFTAAPIVSLPTTSATPMFTINPKSRSSTWLSLLS